MKKEKKSVDTPYGRCSLLSLVQRDCKSLLRFLLPSGKAKSLIIIGYGYSSIATTRYVCGVDLFSSRLIDVSNSLWHFLTKRIFRDTLRTFMQISVEAKQY